MHKPLTLTLVAAAVFTACQGPAPTSPAVVKIPAAIPAAPAADPNDINAILSALNNDDSPSDAVLRLAALLSKSGRNVAYMQQLTTVTQQRLTVQLRMLASANDPEAWSRASAYLSFVDALSRFLADTIEREEEPLGLVDWALDPRHAAAVALAYDRNPSQRSQAAALLVAFPERYADTLLARLIDDLDREVALSAINAAYDRPPSDAVVDALWNKAIISGLKNAGVRLDYAGKLSAREAGQTNLPREVEMRGRLIQIYDSNIALSLRSADGDVATDLLVFYKSDIVKARIADFFETLKENPANGQTIRYLLSPRYGNVSGNATRLVQAYRPPNAIAALLGFLVGSPEDGYEQVINGQNTYTSSRTEILGFLVTLAGLDKDKFHLTQMQQWGTTWMIVGGAKEESEGIKTLTAWWKDNYKTFGATSPDFTVPANIEPDRYGRYGRGRMRW